MQNIAVIIGECNTIMLAIIMLGGEKVERWNGKMESSTGEGTQVGNDYPIIRFRIYCWLINKAWCWVSIRYLRVKPKALLLSGRLPKPRWIVLNRLSILATRLRSLVIGV